MLTNQTQYREVKRKAAVGERIKIVRPLCALGYSLGDEGVTVLAYDGPGVRAAINGNTRAIFNEEYVVLEPVESALSPLGTSSLKSDPLYAAFRQLIVDNADAIRAILPQVEVQLSAEPPLRLAPVKPLARAQVIAKATADVAELKRSGLSTFANLPQESPLFGIYYVVEFYVNRDKRAVTALVKRGSIVYAKHTAKCSPADVFHAELGKAIALRKALGLPVPSEYTDAPQPDEPRKGAKVFSATSWGTFTIAEDVSITRRRMTSECYAGLRDCDVHGSPRILDDTDVDYSAAGTEVAA